MNLPGIGVFSIDPALTVPEASDKTLLEFIQQIKYTQKPITQPDEDFISFIRSETGKIKPLAESDLDSFLSDGKILLNIGKPFHFEGIGSLLKTREGVYEFTAGEPMLNRMDHHFGEPKEEMPKKRSVYHEDRHVQTNGLRKILVASSIIAGIALIIWGGYSMYNRHPDEAEPEPISISDDQPGAAVSQPVDSLKPATTADSAKNIAGVSIVPSGAYRFVIERTNRPGRAIRRYTQLKSYYKDVQMETKDSLTFSLYFVLPAMPADTAKIRDSLKRLYGSKQVLIER